MKWCFVFGIILCAVVAVNAEQSLVQVMEESLDIVCQWIMKEYTKSDWNEECVEAESGCYFNMSKGVCTYGYGNDEECNCTNSSSVDLSMVNMMASEAARASSKFHEAACRTEHIEDSIFAARNISSLLTNIYAGFPSGITRVWPAYNWARTITSTGCYVSGYCPDFDPRRRPWYGLAAAGPLDVVVLIDTSSEMGVQNRLTKAKSAAKAVIGSLASGLSFAQVITFGSASKPAKSEGSLLVRCNATGSDIDSLQEFIELTESETNTVGTNITGAFSLAFQILLNSRKNPLLTTNCRTAIVCLSASTISTLESHITELVSAWNSTESAENSPRIFMYTYGTDDSIGSEHKAIACSNNGLWQQMSDSDADHSNVALGWVEYFSAGNLDSSPRWSPPYSDASGLGTVITASKACRWEMTVPPKLLAVVGTDFAIDTKPAEWTPERVLNLTISSSKCGPFQLNKYDVEQLRGENRCDVGMNKIVVGISIALAIIIVFLTSIILICTTRAGGISKGSSDSASSSNPSTAVVLENVDNDAANEHASKNH